MTSAFPARDSQEEGPAISRRSHGSPRGTASTAGGTRDPGLPSDSLDFWSSQGQSLPPQEVHAAHLQAAPLVS